jgi:hypothetical protein
MRKKNMKKRKLPTQLFTLLNCEPESVVELQFFNGFFPNETEGFFSASLTLPSRFLFLGRHRGPVQIG